MVSVNPQDDVDNEVEVEEVENNGALADIMAAVEASEKAAAGEPEETTQAPAKPEATEAAPAETNDGAPAAAGTEKPHDPLATWKQADKEMFAELPKGAQDFVLRRERERDGLLTKKLEEVADFKREYGAIDDMFKPYKPQMQADGLTPYAIIQAWSNVEKALMDGRGEQVIRDIAKNYKIDLLKAAGAAPAPQPDLTDEQRAQQELAAILNPVLTPLQKQNAELEARLKKFEQFQNDFSSSQQTQRVQQVQNEILNFANATDAQGKLAHPYFKDVEEEMGFLAQACKAQGKPVVLQELYDHAVWANTSTRERMLKAQNTATISSNPQGARAKAVASKRAGSSITGSANAAPIRGNGEPKSVREAIEAAFEDVEGR